MVVPDGDLEIVFKIAPRQESVTETCQTFSFWLLDLQLNGGLPLVGLTQGGLLVDSYWLIGQGRGTRCM